MVRQVTSPKSVSYPKIVLKNHHEHRVKDGHLWVFSNEIEKTEGTILAGGIVDIFSHREEFLGRGYYNPHSLISARILTRTEEGIDIEFFSKRIEKAKKERESLYPGESSYRLIFGESDFLPGVVIDRYQNCFVIRSYSLGSDLLLPMILEALKENFKTDCIIKKNDISMRSMEQLSQTVEIIDGKIDFPISINQKFGEKSLTFFVDPIHGQKSGFFFDQRENRQRLHDYASGKRVLDCFSYTGAFGLYGAQSGAATVTTIDSSQNACDLTKKNFDANGQNAFILHGDVEKLLDQFQKEKRKFDIIILDPPALVQSKKNIFNASRKYKRLNEQALSLLEEGGTIFSCSCSHHLGREPFIKMINDAGRKEGKEVRIIEMRGQSRDHPVLASMPETDYLKCAILQIS